MLVGAEIEKSYLRAPMEICEAASEAIVTNRSKRFN